MSSQRVAIYCRLSDEDRNKKTEFEDSESIQNQKNLLTEYAIRKEWQIYKIYSDDDFSGIDDDRPEYKQMIADAESGKFNIVLCKHQSRFTRNMEHLERYVHYLFPSWGIRFVSIIDNADTEVEGNKKSRQINGLINEWYLEDVSNNVKAVMRAKKRQGLFVGSFAPYGYLKDPEDKHHLIIDPETAPVVKQIFDLYIKGKSLRKIAYILNKQGFPCPVKYKQDIQKLNYKVDNTRVASKRIWTDSTINLILKNQTYVGDVVQGKSATKSYKDHRVERVPKEKWIIVPDMHEAIIDRADFKLVQNMEKPIFRNTKDGNVSLYAGKLRCGECNSSLVRQSSRGVYYYRCGFSQRNSDCCKGVNVKEDLLTEHFLNELRENIKNHISADDLLKSVEVEDIKEQSIKILRKREEACRAQLLELERACEQLYLDKCKGVVLENQFIKMNNAFNLKMEEHTKELSKILEKLGEMDRIKEIMDEKVKKEEEKRKIVEQYLKVEKVTREMVTELIDYIVVERIGDSGKKISIHWLI